MASERSELFIVPKAGSDLPFTGERFTFAAGGVIEQEHTHRYFFAMDLCRGRDVLDVASGEGYGSALLGLVARSVIGVDLDAASVEHAARYYRRPQVTFLVGETSALPVEEASVDVVVSFETLEHTEDHERFLKEIRRVLRPGGLLIMSSPDRDVYSPTGPHNPYHLKELDRAEFAHLVRRSFRHVTLLGQRSLSGSCLVVDGEPLSTKSLFFERMGVNQLKLSSLLPKPVYLLAVASNRELPPLPSSLLIDGRYANWLEVERQRLAADLDSRERSEGELRALLDATRGVNARLEVGVADLTGELERVRGDLGRMAAAHAAEIADLRRELSERDAQVKTLEESGRQDAQRLSLLTADRDRLEVSAGRIPALEESLRQGAQHLSLLAAERNSLEASARRIPGLEESLQEHARRLSMLVAERERLLSSTSWRLTGPLRWLVTTTRAWNGAMRRRMAHFRSRFVRLALGRWHRDAHIISDSGLFDARWYVEQNPDVAASGLAPLEHFAKYGAAEKRDPHSLFSTWRYLEDNPDVARSGMNALVHFVLRGRAEGRRARPVLGEGPGGSALRYAVREEHLRPSATPVPRSRPPVLCVTHVPPWPRRAGNEYRIGRMLDWMIARGHQTVVVLAPLGAEDAPNEHDTQEMVRRYGNVILSLPDGRVDARFTMPGLSLARLAGQPFHADGPGAGDASPPTADALSEVERRFCHDALVGVLLELERSAAPCVLYVNYIFMTRFLPLTSGRSASFVDTHDVFSTKRHRLGRFGIEDPLSLSPEAEARCLRRADAVVAIQPEEAALLTSLVPDRTVLTAGVDFDCDASATSSESPVVVCVASDNALNVEGLRDFLRFAWPVIRREVPDARLVLAGKAASAVAPDDAGAGVEVRGVVDDVAPLYREARVAINPAVAGTGLKIKTIEALRHFRPIVVWPHGVDGVTDEELRSLCLVVRDWYEFAWRTVEALREPRALPDAEAQARIRRALAPDTVYRDLQHWLDQTPAAVRGSGGSDP